MNVNRLRVTVAVVAVATASFVLYALLSGLWFPTGTFLVAVSLILIVAAATTLGVLSKSTFPFRVLAPYALAVVALFMLASVAFSTLGLQRLLWDSVLPVRIMVFGMLAGIALFISGVLWAPFGGRMCSRLAWDREDKLDLPVLEGALASILFLAPWFYLMSLLRDEPSTGKIIWIGYSAIFGLWLWGPGGFMLVVAAFVIFNGYEAVAGIASYSRPLVAVLILSGFTCIGPVVTGWLWYRSTKNLLKTHGWNRRLIESVTSSSIPTGYLSPFKSAFASYVVSYVASIFIFVIGSIFFSN